MATITKTHIEDNYGSSYQSTWTFTITGTNIVASDTTFTLVTPSVKAKYVGSSKGYAMVGGDSGIIRIGNEHIEILQASRASYGKGQFNAWTSGTTNTLVKNSPSTSSQRGKHSVILNTADFFNDTNPTIRTLNIESVDGVLQGASASNKSGTTHMNMTTITSDWGTFATLTLNAPPRFTSGNLSFDTTEIYAGITTVSVDVDVTSAGLGAQYDGTISSIVLTVGNQQSNILTTSGTLSILLDEPGTFTPSITVTDSRGQTSNVGWVNPITVLPYICQVSGVKVERIDTNGKSDDEGTNVALQGTFTHTHDTTANSTLITPLVQLDNNGTLTTINNVTWYTNWTPTGGFSGSITSNSDWQALTSPVTIYAKLTDTFAKENSYELLITPKTTRNTTGGVSMTVTVPQSFYLLVGAAGGHGLGIGMKPPTDALYVDMDSYFNKDIIINDALQNSPMTMRTEMGVLNILGDGIAINGQFKDFYKITTVQKVISGGINANSYVAAANISMTAQSGYNAVGIVGHSSSNFRVQPTTNYVSNNTTIFAGFANWSASNVTSDVTVIFYVLWLKATAAS